MNVLKVVSIQRGCVYDGPGVRTVIFLKGCNFQCPWCCNPEAISQEDQIFIDYKRCLAKRGISSTLCHDCVETGGDKSIEQCPFGVSEPVSKEMSEREIFEEILKDSHLYQKTGGVTFSGGEPLLHSNKLYNLLKSIFDEGISVFMETTLSIPYEVWSAILPNINGFIVDLKLQPQMKLYDISYLKLIKRNLSYLSNKKVTYRMVYVDEMYDLYGEILNRLNYIGVDNIELLPCHSLGFAKYEKLGLKATSFSVEGEKLEKFSKILGANHIGVQLMRI